MIEILRLGHRIARDKRVTTHLALVGRAFGASSMVITKKNSGIEKTIEKVNRKFGGDFKIYTCTNWEKYIKDWKKKGIVVHLTMYGLPIEETINKIDKNKDILVIVGSKKVPGIVYKLADYNISIGNQPHSEISAIAIFLDRIFEGKRKEFNSKISILPCERGKKVLRKFDREECIGLLRKEGCQEEIIKHCLFVHEIAKKIGIKAHADLGLIETAALLHDIGRSKTNDVGHGVEGGKILRKLGLPEEIALIVERHVGAGIDEEEAEKLGLPKKSYIPITLEEKIVCHADNLVSHNRKQRIEEEIIRLKKNGLEKAAKRMLLLHKELSRLCGIDLNEI